MITFCTLCESVINLTYSEQLQFSHRCSNISAMVAPLQFRIIALNQMIFGEMVKNQRVNQYCNLPTGRPEGWGKIRPIFG